jgi:hypothetical protein
MIADVFHIELRQFPHVTRAFNLSREQLFARILRPWASGAALELNERRWSPQKARLSIYEGPELATEELGLGRGWSKVIRGGEDVTAGLLAELQSPPALEAFKRQIVTAARGGGIGVPQLVELAAEQHPRWRASEQLALAEEAVWALLHGGELRMVRGEQPIGPDQWRDALLAWDTWTSGAVRLSPPPSG